MKADTVVKVAEQGISPSSRFEIRAVKLHEGQACNLKVHEEIIAVSPEAGGFMLLIVPKGSFRK